MKDGNQSIANRLKRNPVWCWEPDTDFTIAEDTKNGDETETESLRLLAITWNMHGEREPTNAEDLLRLDIPHDIYVIGTQECMRSIASSALNPSKKVWADTL